MRPLCAVAAFSLVLAVPALAQAPPAPAPDGQRPRFQPGQEPTAEMRARFDSMRTQMEGFQAEADQWVAAIRNNLTPDQQTKFDALAKPQVARRGGMGGAPPRP